MLELFHVWLLMVIATLYAVTMFVFVLLSVKSRISFSDEKVVTHLMRLLSTPKTALAH